MRRKRTTFLIAIALCGLLVAAGSTFALSSANFSIDWQAITGGSDISSSANYTMEGSIGQPITETPSSMDYQLTTGYWYPMASAASYTATHGLFPGGGGNATSDNYTIAGTIGQPLVEESASTSYEQTAGHWFHGNLSTDLTRSVMTATGTGTATFTTSHGCFSYLAPVDPALLPCSAQTGLAFPHGFFSLIISGVSDNSTVILTINLPLDMPVGTKYYQCDDGTCIDLTHLLGDDDGDNILTLTITDGGPGDEDGTENGTIIHIGGFGTPVLTTLSMAIEADRPLVTSGDAIGKTIPPYDITYTVSLTNGDTPLVRDSVYNTLVGDITHLFSDNLTPGESDIVSYTYTVTGSEPAPLFNTVVAHYHPVGVPQHDVSITTQFSIPVIYLPFIEVTLIGDVISKIGDTTTYNVTITNVTNIDVDLDNINDSLIGDISSYFAPVLPTGSSDNASYTRAIQQGDTDPLVSTVTAVYSHEGSYGDNPIAIDDTTYDIWSMPLVNPGITLTKTGDAISKVSDNITYTISITNTGDVPLVTDNVTDTLLRDITGKFASILYAGATDSVDFPYTVMPKDDGDYLFNEVTANYHPLFLTNPLSVSDNHTVDLVHPSISLFKSADNAISKVGDDIKYTYTITNTSPDVSLVRNSAIDDISGHIIDLTPSFPETLDAGASSNVTYTYTVQEDDKDPLPNTITVHYHPERLTNDISASASVSTELVHPDIMVIKEADMDMAGVSETITYTVQVSNTADVILDRDKATDSVAGDLTVDFPTSLLIGASKNVTYTYTVQDTDLDPLVNTITVHYHPRTLTNDIWDSTAATVSILPSITSLYPPQGVRGETLNVTISGARLNRVTTISFGAGITINSFNIDSASQIIVNITIDDDAVLGLRDVSVTNPAGTQTLIDGFTVGQLHQVNTATGTGIATFSTSNGTVEDLTASAQAQLNCGAPPPYYFPHGFFSFDILGLTPGATVTITIILPSPVPPTTQYWKCQNGTWIDCTSLLGDNDGDNLITLTITDGQLGDGDGQADGTIHDPGGPCFASGTSIRRYEGASTGDLAVRRTPPNLKAKYIAVTPKAAQVNQPITITTNVVNEGEISGSHVVALTINGKVEQTKTVTVRPGATRQVSFTVSRTEPGYYQVSIGNQRSTFLVAGPQKAQPSQTTGGLAIGLATLVLVVVSGLFIITLRRRLAEKD